MSKAAFRAPTSLIVACVVFLMPLLSMNEGNAFGQPSRVKEGRVVSADGRITLEYRIEDGYKIHIAINTAGKRNAYVASLRADVYQIEADFLDLNDDGRIDVIVKYSDEAGYSPRFLLNHEDASFFDVTPDTKGLEFRFDIYHRDIKDGGIPSPKPEYYLADVSGDAIPELVFKSLWLGRKGYRDVVLQLDALKKRYIVIRKGEQLSTSP